MSEEILFKIERTLKNRFVGPSDHAPCLRLLSDLDVTVGDAYKVHFGFEDPRGALYLKTCTATDLHTGETVALTKPIDNLSLLPLQKWTENVDKPTDLKGFTYDAVQKKLIVTDNASCKSFWEGNSVGGCIRTISCFLSDEKHHTTGLIFNFLDGILYAVMKENGCLWLSNVTLDGREVSEISLNNLSAGTRYFHPKDESNYFIRNCCYFKQLNNTK